MSRQYTIKKALNMLRWRDICHVLLAMFVFPFAIVAKIFIRNFWLICEDKNRCSDNAYWLFKWVRENKPKQKVAFALNKKCGEYQNVKDLGRVIKFGGISHWFWYIVADKNISSQKDGKPNAAATYLFEVILGLRKNNRIFLQHGITINNAEWLYYKNTKMRLFITGAIQEQEAIKANFGYPEDNVKLLGFSRFDNLDNSLTEKDLIVVMPTWREWLGTFYHDSKNLDFSKTNYCEKWNEFLNSERLDKILKANNKKLLFYPHFHMQQFLNFFSTKSSCIKIASINDYNVQNLLKRASLVITDYSSIFFDVLYMSKPVMFYQFDEQEFREKQYKEGWFNYKNNKLCSWSDNLDKFLDQFEAKLLEKDQIDKNEYLKLFKYIDKNNSERIYNAINKL